MSLSPTNSSVYVNYSSIFSQSQGQNRGFSAIQAAASAYSNGAFQVRNASVGVLDILDLSKEGLAQADQTKPTTLPQTGETTGEVSDVTLEAPEITEDQRVEMIRVNKNAVLARVNELLAEKGIEVPAEQRFELKVNFMDGSVEATGIEDPELAAAFNEALAGDEELVARMKKTRDELGLPDQPNTVPRNFTIQFGSMEETPADAEIEYKIDLFVNQIPQQTEETEGTEAVDETQAVAKQEVPTFQMSIVLSNRAKQAAAAQLLEGLDQAVQADKTDEKKTDSKIKQDSSSESDDEIPADDEIDNSLAGEVSAEDDVSAESNPTDMGIWAFGSYFKADSKINFSPDGLVHDWSIQINNWDLSNSTSANSSQRVFETMTIGGSALYTGDPENPQSLQEQAELLNTSFVSEMNNWFSQNQPASWIFDFIQQNGINGIVGLNSI